MKKNKKIICLLVTLITLCASSLTVYASEITESGAENNEQENMYSFNDYVYDDEGNIIINAFGYFPEGSTNQSCAYSVRGSYPIKELVSGVTDFENTYPLIYKNWYTASNGEKIYYFVWAVAKNNNGKIGLYTFNMKGTIATADSDNVNNGKTGAYFPTDTLNGKTLNANIPIFENIEDAEKYVINGDKDGIQNKPPIPEKDEAFEFVNFDSNEYVSFSWSGTTFDDRANEFDKMGFEVEVGYSYAESKEIAESIFVVTNGDLSTNGWSRRQLALKPEDWGFEDMYLRSVSIRPYYTKYGQMCLGKTETIYLTEEGNLDYAVNEELTFIIDEDFYILGASVVNSNLGLVDGDVRSYISWTGTTRDDRICKIPLDKAYAETLCLCYSSGMKPVFVEYCELDPDFFGGDTLPLRKSSSDSTQGFYLNYTEVYEAARARGLEFAGKMYITPYYFYEYENAIYKGAVTVIDVLNNELEINPDSGNIIAPDLTKPTPSPTPTAGTENEGIEGDAGTLDDDLTFDNAFPMFWKMLKSLWASMGQFPSLMYSLFPYLPEELYKIIGVVLIGIVIFRFLGR